MYNFISSAQNPKIKHLLQLQQKSALRRSEQMFVAEGARELSRLIKAGFEIDSIFFCPSILGKGSWASLPSEFPSTAKCFEVSEEVYNKIAYREGTEGVIAEVRTREMHLSELPAKEDALYAVLESVEKPGNLGAVLRSADACGADAVIVCDPLTDIWNPNLIRNSTGAIFSVPCIACSSQECIAFLKERGVRILTAQLQDSQLYYNTDMRSSTAIVMGTESTGLSEIWRKAADAHIRIPMLGMLDSLNVSVSAAILLFEALRQRNG